MKYLEWSLFGINSVLGVAITLEDARNIIGIVILIFQALLVIYNVISKVIKHIKSGKTDEIPQTIQDGINALEEMKGDDHNGKSNTN